MQSVSISQGYCPRCGAISAAHQRFCPSCGQQGEQDNPGESEATQRVSAREPLYLSEASSSVRCDEVTQQVAAGSVRAASHDEEFMRVGDGGDGDATIRVARRAPAHVLRQAERQELQAAAHSPIARRRRPRGRLVGLSSCVGLVLLIALTVFGIGGYQGDPLPRRQAAQAKARLDSSIAHARRLGVTSAQLRPVLQAEQQLSSAHPPLTFFSGQPLTAFYRDQSLRYGQLLARVPAAITHASEQDQVLAQQDIQNFQTALTAAQQQGSGTIDAFTQEFSQDELLLSTARNPADFASISMDARQATLALHAREMTLGQLNDFAATTGRLGASHLDVTAMRAEYQMDLNAFDNATQPLAFENLGTQINAQYQQAVVNSVQAFPFVSLTKLNELAAQIRQLQSYGMDASHYQARLNADQVAEGNARTVYAEIVFLTQVDTDVASMRDTLAHGEASYLVKQFHAEVNSWARAHPYHDGFDGRTYALVAGYMNAGIGSTLDSDLSSAASTADFEALIEEAQNALFNLHECEADYGDHSPYTRSHASDLRIIGHYKLLQKQLLMVSLVEQAMRVYQNGKLVAAYHITSGRQELPSLPGVWPVLDRKSPVIFQSADPPGSPYWFPNTPINYAILYHYGGYFVHDAPWRADFGPGTQFPHADASGTTAYNFDGSHGCINLQESDAAWVYRHTNWNTLIVLY
jgi:L,D-transpeptidase catalytic domain